jgi:hypothetical protein
MTGMHALHMVIGAGLLICFIAQAWKGRYGAHYYGPVEVMALAACPPPAIRAVFQEIHMLPAV